MTRPGSPSRAAVVEPANGNVLLTTWQPIRRTTPRTGTLTIAGQTVTVTQEGACAYTVAPTTQNVLAAGGSQSVAVTTASGCNWTGVSNDTTLDRHHERQ